MKSHISVVLIMLYIIVSVKGHSSVKRTSAFMSAHFIFVITGLFLINLIQFGCFYVLSNLRYQLILLEENLKNISYICRKQKYINEELQVQVWIQLVFVIRRHIRIKRWIFLNFLDVGFLFSLTYRMSLKS